MSARSTPIPPSEKSTSDASISKKSVSGRSVPSSFLLRRAHSLMGICLVIFLIEHLFTNSQAALWIGQDGSGFVRMVERIHSLPYLHLIEWALLGMPLLIHLVWGLFYAKEAQFNSLKGELNRPYMPYARSRAFTFQRISAWFLAFAVLAHILHLRVWKDPIGIERAHGFQYVVKVHEDEGLASVADRLGVEVWNKKQVSDKLEKASHKLIQAESSSSNLSKEEREYQFLNRLNQTLNKPDERLISTPSVGLAMLMMVRDVFKTSWICALYSLFVLAAVYHACNGLWTSLIKWGITPKSQMQSISFWLCLGLMVILSGLGLCAIWLTYWVNLAR